jgi:hypothetical protein
MGNLWPKIAFYFGMEIKLTEMMGDKASLWDHIVDQHGLRCIPYDQIVSWGYGDFVFGAGFDKPLLDFKPGHDLSQRKAICCA